MLKPLHYAAIILSVSFSSYAIAGCVSPSVQVVETPNPPTTHDASLIAVLAYATACYTEGGFTHQEEHRGFAGGVLTDYKKGGSDPVDPTTHIGSWSLSGDTVSYSYLGGATAGPLTLYFNGGTSYSFCSGTSVVQNVSIVKALGSASSVCVAYPS